MSKQREGIERIKRRKAQGLQGVPLDDTFANDDIQKLEKELIYA